MIKSGILEELDHQASLIGKPSFSQDIYDLDKSLWGFICSRKPESELVVFSDFDALAQITNASEVQIKRLYSAVSLSFAPRLKVGEIKQALNTASNNRLKYPKPEIVHFIHHYWMTVKLIAYEKGGSAGAIFGLTEEVVSLIKDLSLNDLYSLSCHLEIRFELRFLPELIPDLIADNCEWRSRFAVNMKRIQQMFRAG